MRLYADHNATSPLLPEIRERVLALLESPLGNPSSPHALGRRARAAIDTARVSIAALVGCESERVVFTATATEANAIALQGRVIAAGAIEHPSVLENAKRAELRLAKADRDGITRALDLSADLVTLQAANNETGVIQPVAELVGKCRLHVDAVQALGKMPAIPSGADSYAVSSHKIGGLPGAAALIVDKATPLWRGGGHERGQRGGTESALAIVAFGLAADAWREHGDRFRANMLAARDAFEHGLSDCEVLGANVARLPNTSCLLVPGVRGEALLSALDLVGIAVSHGSACATGSLEPSHVLLGMGLSDDVARTAIRLSFGPHAREEDGARAARSLMTCAERLRRAR